MEKYNLNEGNEAVKRALLLMKYDSKKTLTENTETLNESGYLWKLVDGSIVPGTSLPPGKIPAGARLVTGASRLGPLLGTIAANPWTWAVAIPTLAGLGIWLYTKDSDAAKVKKLFSMCSDPESKNWKRYMSSTQVRDSSDALYDAMEGMGTDKPAIYAEFKKFKSPGDFCAVRWKYYQDYNEPLFDALDGDLDYGWQPIFRSLRNMIEDYGKKHAKEYCSTHKEECIKKYCKKFPDKCKEDKSTVQKPKVGGGGMKWKHCTDNYTKGCTSGVIGKVQGCLNIKVDDKFGPETEGAVQAKLGKTTFTNADVNKLCEKVSVGGGGDSSGEEIVTPDQVSKDKGF